MKFAHIGWMNEGVHDKVWGMILLHENERPSYYSSNTYLVFWGRRGHKLQTKTEICSPSRAGAMFTTKINKGYQEIPDHRLHKVYPDFKEDIEKTALWAALQT